MASCNLLCRWIPSGRLNYKDMVSYSNFTILVSVTACFSLARLVSKLKYRLCTYWLNWIAYLFPAATVEYACPNLHSLSPNWFIQEDTVVEFNLYCPERLKSHFGVTDLIVEFFVWRSTPSLWEQNYSYFSLVRDAKKIIYPTKTIKLCGNMWPNSFEVMWLQSKIMTLYLHLK